MNNPDVVSNPDQDLLKRWKSQFAQAWQAEKKWREKKRSWQNFYDGEQLSQDEKTELKKRGQPEVVVNRIKPKIDGIVGIELGARVLMKAFDRGNQDFNTAKHITEALRYIDYHNNFDDQESEACEDMLIGGRSWYKHTVCFEDLDAELITRWASSDDIVKDPYSKRADLSDAKHIFETVWVDLEDAKELFPDSCDDLEGAFLKQTTFQDVIPGQVEQDRPDQYAQERNDSIGLSEDMFVDRKRKRVRLITIWYREPVRAEYVYHKDLGTKDITDERAKDKKLLFKNFLGAVTWTDLNYTLNTATFTINCILEQKKDVRSYDKKAKFPFVMVPGYVSRDDDRMPYGLVKQMVDPQMEINKRRSKMLHLLNVAQIIMEDGAVESVEKTRQEVARPDGIIVHRKDFEFQVQRGADLAQPHFELLQEAKREIDESGVNSEVTGTPSTATSGRMVQLRQQQATQVLRKLFSNLRGARKRVAQLWLEDLQHYWTDEKLVRITDDPEAGAIVLNKKVQDPDTGQVITLNDVSLGKYDIIIEESPDTLNLRQEQFQSLIQLANAKYPVPFDMIIEASDLPNKKQLLERLQQQQQAQAQQQQMMMQQAQAQGG